ncbi:MAG: hypothetical protein H3C43_06145 [Leptonema sp. (in: Bacteria)]|nr:hypothetical protein [Leptonema sp. (in: bacteria)]
MFRYSITLLLLAFVTGCDSPSQGRRAVYYWRTSFNVNIENVIELNTLQVSRLYVRIFDVDSQNNRFYPVAPLRVESPFPKGFTFVPVIYITPFALRGLNSANAIPLADTILKTLQEFRTEQNWPDYSELQLDADWSITNEEPYFELLQHVRKQLNLMGKQLSCTIRLHQLGSVNPPVDRQLIMIYNIDSLTNANASKTILNSKLAKKYIGDKLRHHGQIDIALPIYTWLSHFHGHRFLGLINGVAEYDLKKAPVKKLRNGWFEAEKSFRLGGRKIPKGDLLRFEDSLADSVDMANWLQEKIDIPQLQNSNMILFHYDSTLFSDRRKPSIKKIYSGY